jgi:hypothetical protein
MASTGLLGFNPYGKGVVFDISSKPTNLAIQLEQKEAAKRDALQKYLMDYEKSLNPAGMRSVDQNAFLSKLNEAKQYNLKNTQQILNPSKYGSDAQSTYTNLLKEAQNIIEQSKMQAADDKIVNEHIYQATQKGQTIHDGLLPSIEASRLSIVDPKFKRVNPWELKFDEKYDDNDLVKNVWSGITLPTRGDIVKEKLPTGEVIYAKQSYLTPEIKSTVITGALNDYTTKPGAATHFNELIRNPQIYANVNSAFGEAFKYTDPATQKEVKPNIGDKIPGLNLDPTQQFVAGYALMKKPIGEVSTSQPEMPWMTKFNIEEAGRKKRHQETLKRMSQTSSVPVEDQGNELDNIEDIPFRNGGGVKGGIALDANGNRWSGEATIPQNKVPGLLFDMIGADPKDVVVTYENGVPVKMIHPQVGNISRQAVEAYQLKFNTEPAKGRQIKFGKPKSESKTKFVGIPKGGF